MLTAAMRLFYTDHFQLPLPANHRFPIAKYRLLRERIATSDLARRCDLLVPAAATDEQLCLAHTPDYVRRVATGALTDEQIRRIGFPWSPELVERSRRSVGATLAAARAALHETVSASLAGGTHHASAECGEGFCVFNDVAVAARTVQREGLVRRAVVIDCDVHQGNGTAAIFADDPSVFTFSIHCGNNFPARKYPGDLDISLVRGAGDDQYLDALREGVELALRDADAEIAFYLAGADPFHGDRLGRLKLSKPGLARRDELVLEACRRRRLPVAITMAGGYAEDVTDVVDIHAATIRLAAGLGGPNKSGTGTLT
jgi:acetoin utilization deacetylase AcuC-like enzyme